MLEANITINSSDLESLPIFPLPNAILFPGAAMPLHVFEPRYRQMTQDVLSKNRLLAVARLRPGFEATYYERPPVYDVCGVGYLDYHRQYPDGRYDILVQGLARVRILSELPPLRAYRLVRAQRIDETAEYDALALIAWQRELRAVWERISPHLPVHARDLFERAGKNSDLGLQTDRIAAAIIADPDERQQMLEESNPSERFCRLVQRAHELLAALSQEPSSHTN